MTDWADKAAGHIVRYMNERYGGNPMYDTTWNEPLAAIIRECAQVTHGKTCPKMEHNGTGYLHKHDDDSPYSVDGVLYCGRCHIAI